ncbi:diguanylate cyclase [bacterium]|nr:diguanylate cyclase [bacterium]
MKLNYGLASQLNHKHLISLFNKVEKNKKSLIEEIEKYINQLPDTVVNEANYQYLPSILDVIFKEISQFRKKINNGRVDLALKRLRKGVTQLASTSRSFSTFVVVWTVFREIALGYSQKWFSQRQLKHVIMAGEKFWTLSFIEIMNAYLQYSDEIIRENTLESSVLFHATQSITTEMDLESLLNKIVFHAGMLLRNKKMFLFVAEADSKDPKQKRRLVLRASNQEGESYGEYSLRIGEGPIGRVAEENIPVLNNNYSQSSKKLSFLNNTAHLLAVPITFSDEILGVLLASEQRKSELITNSEKELLLMYAQQIAITFKNVLLYQEQAKVARELEEKNKQLEKQADLVLRRTAQMVVLNEVSQKVNSSLDLKEVISLLARQAAESIGLDRCVVWLFDDMKINLEAIAAYGISNKVLSSMRFQLSDIRNTIFFKTLSELSTNQIQVGEDAEMFSEVLEGHLLLNTMLVVPLVLQEEAIGILAVEDTRESHEFLDDEITLISAIANHTVMAIENARLYQKVREQAITDGLTGVYNHRFFQIRYSDEYNNSKRYGNDMSLIILDIDHFKQYNDTYGHMAGDLALKEIANLTRDSVRENDIVARYGGEEFAIILPMTNLKGAEVVAERIRTSILECRFLGDLNVPQVAITVSMGVSAYSKDMDSREELFRQTDNALYYAKEHGRNKTVVYSPELMDSSAQ